MNKTEMYLKEHYMFYVDEISKITYYKPKGNENDEFQKLNDYSFNSIYRELKNNKIQSISKDDLRILLFSDYVPLVNPFIQFLDSIVYDDNVDYIAKIASTVKTENDEYFQWIFKKWFVNLVACVTGEGITNENMIILVGKQGIGKTRWTESLLPKELQNYYYGDDIDPKNKDHKALFATRIIINIDELTSFSHSKVEQFKSILSAKKLTFRRPYGSFNEDFNRIASLIGSSNHKDVLMDTSGNRRYLCIDTLAFENIDTNDLKKAYKQAYQMYQEGFQYYFDREEIEKINEINLDYVQVDEATELINQHFEVCNVNDHSAKYMNATEVLNYLKKSCGIASVPPAQALGRLLTSLGFKDKKINGSKKYAMLIKSQDNKEIKEPILKMVKIMNQTRTSTQLN